MTEGSEPRPASMRRSEVSAPRRGSAARGAAPSPATAESASSVRLVIVVRAAHLVVEEMREGWAADRAPRGPCPDLLLILGDDDRVDPEWSSTAAISSADGVGIDGHRNRAGSSAPQLSTSRAAAD